MQSQHAQLCLDTVPLLARLPPGGIQRDGNIAQVPAAVAGGKREHVGGRVVAAIIAIPCANLAIADQLQAELAANSASLG